ncbi:MAG: hypothetical protein OER95_06675, partial [Acidimicrobiia bacterium]|nr:hypothetical protein [Acidimicrobiia bacterium]
MATDGVQQKSGDHDDVDADIVDALIEPDEPSDAGSPAVGTDHRPVVEESSGSEPNALVDDAAPGDTVTLGVDDPFKPEPRPVLFTGPASDDTVLEMRQVAGLTAGSMMKLTLGRAFEFNESNEGGSFSLRVLETGEVLVHPGSAKAVVDEIDVTEPTLIGDAILNVSSACF